MICMEHKWSYVSGLRGPHGPIKDFRRCSSCGKEQNKEHDKDYGDWWKDAYDDEKEFEVQS